MHRTIVLTIALLLLTLVAKPAYATSADTSCGIIWDTPIQLSDSTYSSHRPQIALSGDDTIHVTWPEGPAQHKLPYRRSVTGGQTWEPIRDLITDHVQFPAHMFQTKTLTDGDNVYVFAQRGQIPLSRNVMAKSTDRGTTWQVQYIGIDTVAGLYSTNVKGDTAVVHYQHRMADGTNLPPRLMYSLDGGVTWHVRPDTLDDNSKTALTPGTLHLAQTLVVGNAPELVYQRSFDLGQTWQDRDTLSQVDGRSTIEMGMGSRSDPSGHIMLAWRDAIACAGFLGCTIIGRESPTNGAGWLNRQTLTELPRGREPAVSIGPTGIAAVSWSEGLSLTDFHIVIRVKLDSASTWCPIVDLTPSSATRGGSSLAVSRRAIHVVWSERFEGPPESFRIIYRRGRFIDTDVKEEPTTLPAFTVLGQNYPNPFNPATHIRYSVRGSGFVSVRVFNVLGREVATLVDERQEPGEHAVEWNALTSTGQVLPSGVYYYRLIAGGRIETKKAMLIR